MAQSGEAAKEESRGFEIVGVGGRDSRMKWNWKMTDSGC